MIKLPVRPTPAEPDTFSLPLSHTGKIHTVNENWRRVLAIGDVRANYLLCHLIHVVDQAQQNIRRIRDVEIRPGSALDLYDPFRWTRITLVGEKEDTFDVLYLLRTI